MSNETVTYGRYKSVSLNNLINEVLKRNDVQYMHWSIAHCETFERSHQIYKVVEIFKKYLKDCNHDNDKLENKKRSFHTRDAVDLDTILDKLIGQISKVTITDEKIVIDVVNSSKNP